MNRSSTTGYRVCCSTNGFVSCYANTLMFEDSVQPCGPEPTQSGPCCMIRTTDLALHMQPQKPFANVVKSSCQTSSITLAQLLHTEQVCLPNHRAQVEGLGDCPTKQYPTNAQHTLGPLIIRALDIFLGYASPYLMDVFTPKS
jgi:hypothetical protein